MVVLRMKYSTNIRTTHSAYQFQNLAFTPVQRNPNRHPAGFISLKLKPKVPASTKCVATENFRFQENFKISVLILHVVTNYGTLF